MSDPSLERYYHRPKPHALERLVPLNARRVLEVGCADGALGERLRARQSCQVVGLEPSAALAEQARPRLNKVICCDLEDFDYSTLGEFDAVVCADALPRVKDPARLLRQLWQILSPSGGLVCGIPNARHFLVVEQIARGEWSSLNHVAHLFPGHLRLFARRAAEQLLDQAGFPLVQSIPLYSAEHPDWVRSGRPGTITLNEMKIENLPAAEAEEFFVSQWLFVSRRAPRVDWPLTSIVIPAFDQFEYTKLCIESIFRHTPEPHEIIVVDNASTDQTAAWLKNIPEIKVISNSQNLGFPKACNQGIAAARGDNILLLNNDTQVTSGWLRRLLEGLHSAPDVGLAGPLSNYVTGSQRIHTGLTRAQAIDRFAWELSKKFRGQYIDTDSLCGFCLLFKRELLDKIAPLDENFGIGNFEDQDFCLRAGAAGYRSLVCQDSFVYHYVSRTFKSIDISYDELCQQNLYRLECILAQTEPGAAAQPKKEAPPAAPPKIAIVSLIYNWPTSARSLQEIRGLADALQTAGLDTRHFFPVFPEAAYPASGVGHTQQDSPATRPVVCPGEKISPAELTDRLAEAVTGFSPDVVIIADSGLFAPYLAQALSGFPTVLRFSRAECLCPLNNAHLLGFNNELRRCDSSYLQDPDRCLVCISENADCSDPLHDWERQLAQFGTPAYRNLLLSQLEAARAIFYSNPELVAHFSSIKCQARLVPAGLDTKALDLPLPQGSAHKTLLMNTGTQRLGEEMQIVREAVSRLWSRRRDFRLMITSQYVGQFGEGTHLAGWHTPARLARLYSQANICIIPALGEDFSGIFALEAAAAGRPVVASNLGALRYAVQDGITGLLVEAGQPQALTDALHNLLEDETSYQEMCSAARAHAASFDWQNIITQHYLPLLE